MITANVLSFLIAAVAPAPFRLAEPRPARTETHWRQQFAGGLRLLWRDAPLRRTTVAVAIAALSFGTLEAVMFAYVDRGLHRPPTFLGVLVPLQGIGGLAGGLLAARVINRIGEVATVALAVAGFGAGCLALTYPALVLAAAALPICGASLAAGFVAAVTLMQRRTPAPLMGRVSTTVDMLTTGPQAVSIALGAILVSLVDCRLLFAAVGLVMVLDGGLLLRRPGHREVLLELDDARVGQG